MRSQNIKVKDSNSGEFASPYYNHYELEKTASMRIMKVLGKFAAEISPLNFLLDFVLERLLHRKISTAKSARTQDFFVKKDDYIANQIIAHDLYEKRELEALVSFLSPIHPMLKQGTGIDVGANVGNHSIFLAPFFQEMHSFEPNPKIITLLKLNTGSFTNIKIYEFGLSNANSQKILYVDSENIGGSSTIKGRGKFNSEIEIQLYPLDSLDIKYEKLQLIKIDVEGNEHDVLLGAKDTIQQSMPIILLEQFPHDFDSSDKNSITLLREFGYRFVWMAHDSTNQKKMQRRARRVLNLLIHREITFFLTNSEVPRGHYPMLLAIPPRFFCLLNSDESERVIRSL
jgi:FkbM family methyltransferase